MDMAVASNLKNDRIGFRDLALKEECLKRSASSGVYAKRSLRRYMLLVQRNREQFDFSVSEARLLADAIECEPVEGAKLEDASIFVLWATVALESELHGLGSKWKVDMRVLEGKLRGLKDGELLAVVDAIEQFWLLSRQHDYTDSELGKLLNKVGLVRSESEPDKRNY